MGDFYYIIQLNDGTKINLTDEVLINIVYDDTYNIHNNRSNIEKLDRQYVNIGIHKVSSMDNFQYCTQKFRKNLRELTMQIIGNMKKLFHISVSL